MPTLEFNGKQHIYAHHLTIPSPTPRIRRTLAPATQMISPTTASFTATTTPHKKNRKKPATQDGHRLRRYKHRFKVERFSLG